MSEINHVAEKFLRDYMADQASVEFHRVVCPVHRYEVIDTHESAAEFLTQIQSQGSVISDRIEVSEPTSVVILRVCPKKLPTFLAGTRKDGKLIWTHHNHLACVFNREDGEKVSKRLEEQGVPSFILPAPEVRHSSL